MQACQLSPPGGSRQGIIWFPYSMARLHGQGPITDGTCVVIVRCRTSVRGAGKGVERSEMGK
jgi:hypothetical protein